MKYTLRYLSLACVLILCASLLPLENALARRGGGARGRSGGASPRINSSGNMQNRGNFGGSQGTFDRSQTQQNRQTNTQNLQQNRQTNQQNRQQQVDTNQQNRQTNQQNLQQNQQTNQQNRQQQVDTNQQNRQTNQQNRQQQASDNQQNRQQQVSDNQQNRQDFIDDNYDGDRWYGGGWYGGGYHVPPGWGLAAVTTGLVIGSAISTPPPYYSTVYVGTTSYIYSDGVFLQPSGSSYTIVAPPVDAVVTYLADGCTTVQKNNVSYYSCSGIYYQPFLQNGSTVYRVVQL